MTAESALDEVRAGLEKGAPLEKCRKCECFKGAARAIHDALAHVDAEGTDELRSDIAGWLERMEASEYT